MEEVSKKIIDEYQVRKTKKQKTAFIEFMQNEYPEARVECGGFGNNRNIVIGDVDKADVVLAGHYDTCAVLPFPNFITPRNIPMSILFQLGIAFILIAILGIISGVIGYFCDNTFIGIMVSYVLLIFAVVWMFAGKPNKHTMNDNTSGIITLLEIYHNMDETEKSKVALVFFDNEENGLLGSAYFKKIHKKAMGNKMLINFDCVSDGDTIMLVQNKVAIVEYEHKIKSSFISNEEKEVLLCNSKNTMYPSDQIHFACNIGVASLKKGKRIGYYLDKIHTNHDVNFDERNIKFLVKSTIAFVKTL